MVASRTGASFRSDLAAVPEVVPVRLLAARRVLTVGHESPDADAVGSALALALVLQELGARTEAVFADPVPAMYDFLPAIELARLSVAPDLEPDLIVVCDGDIARTGRVLQENATLFERVPVLNIDHHVSNPGTATVPWVDPTAAATCELVALLLPHLGRELADVGPGVVDLLTAGLVFDTASFAHSNTTPRTLRVAAELVAAGADLPTIVRHIYRTKSNEQLRLFGRVLARLESSTDTRLVWSVLDEADLEATGATTEMTEGVIDLLSQSATAEVVILFKVLGGEVRISVRTRDDGVDATRLTSRFGGGGHARAAGASVAGTMAEARLPVLDLARRLLDELPAG